MNPTDPYQGLANRYPDRWDQLRERSARRLRRRRLAQLVLLGIAALAIVALLAACNPPPAEVAQSGDPYPTPTTTTTTTAPDPTPPEPAAPEPTPTTEPERTAATDQAEVLAAAAAVPQRLPDPEPYQAPDSPALAAIARAFPEAHLYRQATAIARCESELHAGAVSGTDDHGLFQVNAPTWNKPGHPAAWQAVTGTTWASVYDPEVNAQFARWLYNAEGWRPWTCRHVL